jgi:hypothetical protein
MTLAPSTSWACQSRDHPEQGGAREGRREEEDWYMYRDIRGPEKFLFSLVS